MCGDPCTREWGLTKKIPTFHLVHLPARELNFQLLTLEKLEGQEKGSGLTKEQVAVAKRIRKRWKNRLSAQKSRLKSNTRRGKVNDMKYYNQLICF